MAETELSVLSEQCLKRRIALVEELKHEVDAWQQERNQTAAKVIWLQQKMHELNSNTYILLLKWMNPLHLMNHFSAVTAVGCVSLWHGVFMRSIAGVKETLVLSVGGQKDVRCN